MPGSDEGDKQPKVPLMLPLDPIAKALADLAQQKASLWAHLEALESRPPATTTTMQSVFPCSLPAHPSLPFSIGSPPLFRSSLCGVD